MIIIYVLKYKVVVFYHFLVLFHFIKKIKILPSKRYVCILPSYQFLKFFLKEPIQLNQKIVRISRIQKNDLYDGNCFLANIFGNFKYYNCFFLIFLKEICKCFFYFSLYLKAHTLNLLKKLIFFLITK